MEGDKKKVLIVVSICLVLIGVAGTIGYFSRQWIPEEIKPAAQSEKLVETTTAGPTPREQFDLLNATLNTAYHVVQEAPRFFYLMGSKLLTAHVDDGNESNVFSVVKKGNQSDN